MKGTPLTLYIHLVAAEKIYSCNVKARKVVSSVLGLPTVDREFSPSSLTHDYTVSNCIRLDLKLTVTRRCWLKLCVLTEGISVTRVFLSKKWCKSNYAP
jgi:hypothetical protein